MKRILIGAAAVAALALGASGAQAANLVTNGSFETGDFTGWTNAGLQGVATTGSYGEYPQQGNYFATFGNVGGDGIISQVVSDTAGQTLTLSYYLMADGGTPSDFSAAWDGATIAGSSLVNTPDQRGSGYVHYTFNVGATGSDTLKFAGRNDPTYWALDNVSLGVAGVPEPSEWALMILGIGLMGAALRINGRVNKQLARLRA